MDKVRAQKTNPRKNSRNTVIAALALAVLLSALLLLPSARAGEVIATEVRPAEVIDRIVATVNGHIILQSDWDEALCYEALLNGRPLSQFPTMIAARSSTV
jgi:hypothetical protein